MNRLLRFSTLGTLLLLLTGAVLVSERTSAVQLADGTVYFLQAPRLVRATTTFKAIRSLGSTYLFTIMLPENAGEPLHRVEIRLYQGADNPQYNLQESEVFEGTESGPRLARSLTVEEATRSILVVFDSPLAPGKVATIALRPVRNPSVPGVYLFGVTAFPSGAKAHGQFLGYGRLTFTGHRL